MIEKKLLIVRHAKAEDHSFHINDYNRNLIQKGRDKAKKIAQQIKNHWIAPNDNIMVISSSENRAIQTAKLFSEILDYPTEKIYQTDTIYEAHFLNILKEINKIPNNINTLLVFGHNPGLSYLTNYICDSNISLNTAEVAEIKLESNLNFSELSSSTGYLKKIYTVQK